MRWCSANGDAGFRSAEFSEPRKSATNLVLYGNDQMDKDFRFREGEDTPNWVESLRFIVHGAIIELRGASGSTTTIQFDLGCWGVTTTCEGVGDGVEEGNSKKTRMKARKRRDW